MYIFLEDVFGESIDAGEPGLGLLVQHIFVPDFGAVLLAEQCEFVVVDEAHLKLIISVSATANY